MHYYRKDLLQKARENRKNMPPVEVLLWNRLRNNQIGFRIRRQMPIGTYIADFACKSPKLIIEIDGSSHDEKQHYDRIRDAYMIGEGYKVLHFTDQEVVEDIDSVLEAIYQTLTELKNIT